MSIFLQICSLEQETSKVLQKDLTEAENPGE